MNLSSFSILFFFFQCSFAQVLINEYSAANYDQTDFDPGNNAYEDWIELYNSGSSAVSLNGYFLSDKLDNPQKWSFPTGASIPANGYLVVLADSDDEFANGYFHTNFKLTQTKGNEYVLFSSPAGAIIDSIKLNRPNIINQSTGRKTDGAILWGVHETPSPGSANSTTIDRYATKPDFNLAAGFYTGAQTLTLSSTEAGATIYYTTNGDLPSTLSDQYTGPIAIDSTMVIRAMTSAANTSLANSHIETNSYFINTNHTTKVLSVTGGASLQSLFNGTQNEPHGALELFETDGTQLAETTGEFNKHGNDSWAYAQRGVDFIARDQFGTNYTVKDEIFDTKTRGKFQKLILKCGASDNYPFEGQANSNYPGEFGGAHIRDAYVNQMSQLGDLRLDERSVEFAVLYLNGVYWGVYDIREKVDDADYTDYYYDQNKGHLQYLKTWGGTWSEYGGQQAQDDWDDLVDFVTSNNMTIDANYEHVDTTYNIGSLIDYFILNGFIGNSDWLNWNTSWFRGLDPDGDKKKWRYSLWDMDATFNHYTNYSGVPDQSPTADPCLPAALPDLGGQGHVPIWNALLDNDDFFAEYINRYAELSSTVFSCDSMHSLLNSMVAEIDAEMPNQIARWGGTYAEWSANVDSLHSFIDTRCASILDGLVDCESGLSGPYTITINVEPAHAGTVELSSINPQDYPFTHVVFGGVEVPFDADPNTCWLFDYWLIENDTIYPDATSEQMTVNFNSDDTITAHFKPANCILVDISPANAGEVVVNGETYDNFPVLIELEDSATHIFQALPDPLHAFNHWDFDQSNPLPTSSSNPASVYTNSDDTLTVYFDALDFVDITYQVGPSGVANILTDGTNLSGFPVTQSHVLGTSIELKALNIPNYAFTHWESSLHNFLPSSTDDLVSFTPTANDTITVHYLQENHENMVIITQPENAGHLKIDNDYYFNSPSTASLLLGKTIHIKAFPNTGDFFNEWQWSETTPPNTAVSTTFVFSGQDTIFAYFNNTLSLPEDNVHGAEINLYPTYITSDFHVEIKGLDTSKLIFKLYNSNGQKLSETVKTNPNLHSTYDFSLEYPSGLYFFELISDKGSTRYKLVKE
ncbi:MAG: CotH kinase family protein [Flavobacteriales bacterium]